MTLPLIPNIDPEITCLYCRSDKPCEYGVVVLRPGERALIGVHDHCLKTARDQRAQEANTTSSRPSPEAIETRIDVELNYMLQAPPNAVYENALASILDLASQLGARQADLEAIKEWVRQTRSATISQTILDLN